MCHIRYNLNRIIQEVIKNVEAEVNHRDKLHDFYGHLDNSNWCEKYKLCQESTEEPVLSWGKCGELRRLNLMDSMSL